MQPNHRMAFSMKCVRRSTSEQSSNPDAAGSSGVRPIFAAAERGYLRCMRVAIIVMRMYAAQN
jgi:hypothetical protein